MSTAMLYYVKPVQNLANFPALKHFFRCLETSGAGLSCAKTGLYWEPYELEFDAAYRTVWPNKTAATFDEYTTVSQPWETFPEGYSILHLFVLDVQDVLAVRCRIGFASSDSQYYGTSARTTIHMAMTGDKGNFSWPVGFFTGGTFPAELHDKDVAVFSTTFPTYEATVNEATGLPYGNVTGTHIEVRNAYGVELGLGFTIASTPTYGNSNLNAPGSISPSQVCNWSGGKYYGAAWFAFRDGLPADVDDAIAWMAKAWRTGNRAIYPHWEGVF